MLEGVVDRALDEERADIESLRELAVELSVDGIEPSAAARVDR